MYRTDFAISYANEEIGIAGDLYHMLIEKGAVVFFAPKKQAYLFGKSLKSEFSDAFGPATRFVIPVLSKHYPIKDWPMQEFRVAINEQTRRGYEFILPVRIDDITPPQMGGRYHVC